MDIKIIQKIIDKIRNKEKCKELFVKILNFYDDNRLEYNYFYDWQQLNYKGARKLTSLINQEVNT